jgi:hypothetical protein
MDLKELFLNGILDLCSLVLGSCDLDSEPLDSFKGGDFLDYVCGILLLAQNFAVVTLQLWDCIIRDNSEL